LFALQKSVPDGTAVSKKWSNLRDTYRSRRKGLPSGSSLADTKAVRWPYFSAMTFLDDHSDADNPLNLPAPSELPGTSVLSPYFFVGDAAFPLKKFMMKPFPGNTLRWSNGFTITGGTRQKECRYKLNFRISRGRRVVENLFGILAARFRVLLKPIEAWGHNLDPIIEAVCCLHYFLLSVGDTTNPLQKLAKKTC
jgi:hypothetical protein